MIKRWFVRFALVLTMFAPAAIARSTSDIQVPAKQQPVVASAVSAPAPTAPAPDTGGIGVAAVVVPQYGTDWTASTPALAQGNLLGGYACAPTALAMVTAHYNTRYGSGSRTAEQFIANLKPGEFVPDQGVPYQKLARQLSELGYRSVTGHMSSNSEELRQILVTGPTIITAGGTVAGAQASHSLVVTAVSNDGNWVKLNDPADGQNHTLSWAAFDALWAGGSRGVLIITP